MSSDAAEPVPPAEPGASRRRLLILAAVAVAVVAAVAAATVIFSMTRSSSTRDDFDTATVAFEEDLTRLRELAEVRLARPSESIFVNADAAETLREIVALCEDYQRTVHELDIPERAVDQRDRLLALVEIYSTVAVNAAASFGNEPARPLLGFWEDADREWPAAKEALRAELG